MSIFSGVRPFGVSLLVAGWDDDRPYLFQCDPSVSLIILFLNLSDMGFNKTWSTFEFQHIHVFILCCESPPTLTLARSASD